MAANIQVVLKDDVEKLGKSGEIVWKFNRAGSFDFACLIAGHYQAGMAGTVSVAATSSSTTNERK